MRKIIILAFLTIASFIEVKAADPIFVKGDKAINVGVGVEYWRVPITISGEYCVADGILDKVLLVLDSMGELESTGVTAQYTIQIFISCRCQSSFIIRC
jgi:hypothetical protein